MILAKRQLQHGIKEDAIVRSPVASRNTANAIRFLLSDCTVQFDLRL